MLADKETGPALLEDLKGGLSAMPIWMQDILRAPLFDAAEGDQDEHRRIPENHCCQRCRSG